MADKLWKNNKPYTPVVGNPYGTGSGRPITVQGPTVADTLLGINQFLPVTGDIQSGIMAAKDVKQGNYGSAALNSLGLLPFIPALGGVIAKNIPSKTQFEVAHEIAQKNAALPVSEGGLGLPANNTAMDRAKAMGYTTPAYHGTTESFNEFNLQKRGSATDKGWYGPGEYSAPNPTAADAYIMNDWLDYKNGGNIMPLLLKDAEQIPNKFGNITEYVTRNPNQIRSINAAFDPFRRNEADILAGVAAAPVGLLAVDKEKKKKK